MDSTNILNYLTMVSNKSILLNLVMHFIVLLPLASVFFINNTKLKKVIFIGSIFVLYLSVSINALVFGNPFHLITFGILTVFTLIELFRGKMQIAQSQIRINTFIALVFILIGFWYPEFVKANVFQLLLLSPVGIVPCPTLLATLGLLTLGYINVSKPLYIAAVIMGAIYGIIGTFVLGVKLDAALLLLVAYSIYRLVSTRNTSIAKIPA